VLEFELTADDLVAYNLHGFQTNPAMKRQGEIYRVGSSLLVFVALALLAAMVGLVMEGVVIGAVIALILWLLWPEIWLWMARRSAMHLAKSGGLGVPGPCRLWFDEVGVHDATPTGTSSVGWHGIDRIEQDDDHAFIFVGPDEAYVIPKRIGEAPVREFLDEVRLRIPQLAS